MTRFKNYLIDTENAEDAIVNDAYTHYLRGETAITKVMHPNDPSVILTIETFKTGRTIGGTVRQFGVEAGWQNPLNAYLYGKPDQVKTFNSDKSTAEKRLPSWVERAINDHVKHFHVAHAIA